MMKRRRQGFRTYEEHTTDKAYIRLESRLVSRGLSRAASSCIASAAATVYYPDSHRAAYFNEQSKQWADRYSKCGWILAKDYLKGRLTPQQVYDVLAFDEEGDMSIGSDISTRILNYGKARGVVPPEDCEGRYVS